MLYIYVCIYIERERQRELVGGPGVRHVVVVIYMCMYIYIYREREREWLWGVRGCKACCSCWRTAGVSGVRLVPCRKRGKCVFTAARNSFLLLHEMRFYYCTKCVFTCEVGGGLQVWGMFPVGSVGREKVWWVSSALLCSRTSV